MGFGRLWPVTPSAYETNIHRHGEASRSRWHDMRWDKIQWVDFLCPDLQTTASLHVQATAKQYTRTNHSQIHRCGNKKRPNLFLRLTSGVTIWNHVCMLVADTSNTCFEMNFHLRGLSEHFFKLSMQFDVFNAYFVVNIKRWTCVHMHFRCFNINKPVWQH